VYLFWLAKIIYLYQKVTKMFAGFASLELTKGITCL